MKRHIKFPLFMKNDIPIRTLEELRDNFDIESLLVNYANGKLAIWLRDRYYDDLSEEVSKLNKSSKDFSQKLCKLLGIDSKKVFVPKNNVNLNQLSEIDKRKKRINQYTSDKTVIENESIVAFDQNQFDSLIGKNVKKVYLIGKEFDLPHISNDLEIIGVDNPTLYITDKIRFALQERKVNVKNGNLKFKESNGLSYDVISNQEELDIAIKDKSKDKIYLYGKEFYIRNICRKIDFCGVSIAVTLKINKTELDKCKDLNCDFEHLAIRWASPVYDVKVNDIITFGKNKKFGILNWRVVENLNDRVVLILDKTIYLNKFQKHCDSNNEYNNWVESDLRKYLNNDFYFSAFNCDEEKYILNSKTEGIIDKVVIPSYGYVKRLINDKVENLFDRYITSTRIIGSSTYMYAANADLSKHYKHSTNINTVNENCPFRPMITLKK